MRRFGKYRGVTVRLTQKEAQFVLDCLDVFEDGLEGARDATIEDDSLTALEQLIELSAGYSEDRNTVDEIRRKVTNALD